MLQQCPCQVARPHRARNERTSRPAPHPRLTSARPPSPARSLGADSDSATRGATSYCGRGSAAPQGGDPEPEGPGAAASPLSFHPPHRRLRSRGCGFFSSLLPPGPEAAFRFSPVLETPRQTLLRPCKHPGGRCKGSSAVMRGAAAAAGNPQPPGGPELPPPASSERRKAPHLPVPVIAAAEMTVMISSRAAGSHRGASPGETARAAALSRLGLLAPAGRDPLGSARHCAYAPASRPQPLPSEHSRRGANRTAEAARSEPGGGGKLGSVRPGIVGGSSPSSPRPAAAGFFVNGTVGPSGA